MTTKSLSEFIEQLPKAELHLHIEGTLEPEMLFELATKNKVWLPYNSVEELKKAYEFSSLQDFLDLYYDGTKVLITEQDFFELTLAYLEKARQQGVVHAEIMFDPQSHTQRGVEFDTIINGLYRATEQAYRQWGVTSRLIMCFLRHLSEESAFRTLHQALPYKNWIDAIGLDSAEKDNPPSKFHDVFARVRKEGFPVVAHAGEEGPARYVAEAVEKLEAFRIDHGVQSINDAGVVEMLARKQIPLTVCPLSNLALKVVHHLEDHPLRKLMDAGVLVTVNSDDPAYFGGYINENYRAIADALQLSAIAVCQLAKNSIWASMLSEEQKARHLIQIEKYCQEYR